MKQNKLNNLINGMGTGIITFLSVPIMFLNIFSGIVGGVWILFLGAWQLIVVSLVAGFIMPFAYSILALPSMGIGVLAIKLAEKKWSLFAFVLTVISTFYEKLLVMFWVGWVLGFFLQLKDTYNVIPILLLGYSTAISPLAYMAKGEGTDAFGTWFAVFFAEVLYVVTATLIIFGVRVESAYGVSWLIFLIFWLIQLYVVFKAIKQVGNKLNQNTIDVPLEESNAITPGRSDRDSIYSDVLEFIKGKERVSAEILQKQFDIGYARAARLMLHLEEDGYVNSIESTPEAENRKVGKVIEMTLESLGIFSKVAEINVKRNGVEYCLDIQVGSSLENIMKYERNIAVAVAAPTGKVKIQAPIPGRSVVGIFIPTNKSGKP